MVSGVCEGRVVLVTGAGRGLGREYALELSRQGANIVVNDFGVAADGRGADQAPASAVEAEINGLGGVAVSNTDDVADVKGATNAVKVSLDAFGRLDAVVNNAGILRDRVLVNMTPDEWHSVLHVHLDSTYGVSHAAASYWRELSKAGQPVDGRIINTTSVSGLFCNPGQANYAAAKAGIAAFTIVAARELGRYGVTVNAIAPGARTRLTEGVLKAAEDDSSFDPLDPANVAPVVAWLCSAQSSHITGRVFEVTGGGIALCTGWSRGPRVDSHGRRWDAANLGKLVDNLVEEAPPPEPVAGGLAVNS